MERHHVRALAQQAVDQILDHRCTRVRALAGVQRRGYRVVTLDEAMRDPAYARGEDGYNGRYGPSWLHRWAMAEKKPKDFYAGEPEVPGWVLQLAGVASE